MAKSDNNKSKKRSPNEEALLEGVEIIKMSPLFGQLEGMFETRDKNAMGKKTAAIASCESNRYGGIIYKVYLNKDYPLSAKEWAYTIAHCLLHFAFGHFEADKVPGGQNKSGQTKNGQGNSDQGQNNKGDCDKGNGGVNQGTAASFDKQLWNMACDIYIAEFLEDIKFGKPICASAESAREMGREEKQIYEWLMEHGVPEGMFFGTAGIGQMDMQGLEKPVVYTKAWQKQHSPTAQFGWALASSVSDVVCQAGGYDPNVKGCKTKTRAAADWFVNHYPLLGGIAMGFRIIEDERYCMKNEISVAAVDVTVGEIYVNPAARLDEEELKFVLAHEFLHAGLQHHARCQGRDPYLWNVACDFVINGWLNEMHIGRMPQDGLMYDEELKGRSAEEIYDRIVSDIKKYAKEKTFRGYGKGDIIGDGKGSWWMDGATSLDEFCKSALAQGLEYQYGNGRGTIPAGLIEEIRALAMPPIPWDVELGKWFDLYFMPLEARRTYARPSRRQGSTPDIPRPRYVPADIPEFSRTFGVVVDTSGSMSAKLIGYALGAIASYSAAKEVPYARVVFCDADAYDAGYLAPEEIAGRVAVQGRGGTILQPGVDLLIGAKDFPKDAPILIITDGFIESDLQVKREHAFLVPRGRRLPFRPRGKVFYFQDSNA